MATKLKPCPFCGSEPEMAAVAKMGYTRWMDGVSCYNRRCAVQPQALACSMAVAIRRWNKRMAGK